MSFYFHFHFHPVSFRFALFRFIYIFNFFTYSLNHEVNIFLRSGSIHAEDIDDYIGNLGTAGRWIFDIGQSGPKSADLLCYEWFKGAPVVSPNPRLQCPTTSRVAKLDGRFRSEKTSRRRRCFVNVLPRSGPAVRCCYNRRSGSLIKSFPDAGMLFYQGIHGILSQMTNMALPNVV